MELACPKSWKNLHILQIVYPPKDGVELARQGDIKGVGISSRNGNEYLKSLPDDTESNNLGSLPTVSGKNVEEDAR